MMDIFLDTDVIIDYMADRKPFSDNMEKVFALIENKKIKGHTSSLCFSNLFYLLCQDLSKTRTIALLKDLSGVLNILKVDEDSILKALDSEFTDLEDAIQFFTTTDYKRIDLILTRNIKDYKYSTLPVMTPETLLKTYIQTIK
jgi:predicted nucleic acid-binding protein